MMIDEHDDSQRRVADFKSFKHYMKNHHQMKNSRGRIIVLLFFSLKSQCPWNAVQVCGALDFCQNAMQIILLLRREIVRRRRLLLLVETHLLLAFQVRGELRSDIIRGARCVACLMRRCRCGGSRRRCGARAKICCQLLAAHVCNFLKKALHIW